MTYVPPPPPPDLQVTSITPPLSAASGQLVNVAWSVTDTGSGDTGNVSWSDEVVLSADNNLNTTADNFVLGTFANPKGLTSGSSYTASETVTLPVGISGTYTLFVVTDYAHAIAEGDYTNNATSVALTIALTPPPDLQVTSLTAPNGSSGQPLTVNWTVANNGQGPTPPNMSSWVDKVYVSADSALDPTATLLGTYTHNGTLSVGGSYSQTQSVTIPNSLAGNFFILVQTDAGNTVFEGTSGESNNVASLAVTIAMSPLPDLLVQSVQAPAAAIAGQSTSLSWTVLNNGSGATSGQTWYDSLYLSRDQFLDTHSDIYLGSTHNVSGLAAGASYNSSLNVTIPASASGAYYVFVVADAGSAGLRGTGRPHRQHQLQPDRHGGDPRPGHRPDGQLDPDPLQRRRGPVAVRADHLDGDQYRRQPSARELDRCGVPLSDAYMAGERSAGRPGRAQRRAGSRPLVHGNDLGAAARGCAWQLLCHHPVRHSRQRARDGQDEQPAGVDRHDRDGHAGLDPGGDDLRLDRQRAGCQLSRQRAGRAGPGRRRELQSVGRGRVLRPLRCARHAGPVRRRLHEPDQPGPRAHPVEHARGLVFHPAARS